MAILNVNSTRMELNKLKSRLTTTRKGHKLLKNKSDGLLREFFNIYKKILKLREDIKNDMKKGSYYFELAKIKTSTEQTNSTLSNSCQSIEIITTDINIMGVKLPCFSLCEKPTLKKTLNYSFITNSSYMDKSISIYIKITIKLIELSEMEKSLYILETELEKTKRKVNAIENILIPNLEETIKFISLKLEENERSRISALSRIK